MAEYTRDIYMRSKDAQGNTYTDYPVTRGENVILTDGTTAEAAIAEVKAQADIEAATTEEIDAALADL